MQVYAIMLASMLTAHIEGVARGAHSLCESRLGVPSASPFLLGDGHGCALALGPVHASMSISEIVCLSVFLSFCVPMRIPFM